MNVDIRRSEDGANRVPLTKQLLEQLGALKP